MQSERQIERAPRAGPGLLPRREARPWLQLLNAVLALAGPCAELVHHSERPWASVTFSGARHTVLLRFTGEAAASPAENFIAALPDHEFALIGRIVADATIISVDHVVLPEPQVTIAAEFLLLYDS